MASASYLNLEPAFSAYHADWGMFWAMAELSDRLLTALGLDLTRDAMGCGHNAHMHAMLIIVAEA